MEVAYDVWVGEAYEINNGYLNPSRFAVVDSVGNQDIRSVWNAGEPSDELYDVAKWRFGGRFWRDGRKAKGRAYRDSLEGSFILKDDELRHVGVVPSCCVEDSSSFHGERPGVEPGVSSQYREPRDDVVERNGASVAMKRTFIVSFEAVGELQFRISFDLMLLCVGSTLRRDSNLNVEKFLDPPYHFEGLAGSIVPEKADVLRSLGIFPRVGLDLRMIHQRDSKLCRVDNFDPEESVHVVVKRISMFARVSMRQNFPRVHSLEAKVVAVEKISQGFGVVADWVQCWEKHFLRKIE